MTKANCSLLCSRYIVFAMLLVAACGRGDNKKNPEKDSSQIGMLPNIPIDKGFSEYILSYTSGIIPANSPIEIHFTQGFAAVADKSASGVFDFDPQVKGKTEWKDDGTLVFIPSKPLDAGRVYTGRLNLGKLASVKERLNFFPLRVQTVKKDFRITVGALKVSPGSTDYSLEGQVIASDFIDPREAESFVTVKLGRKKLETEWDHTANLIHRFTIAGISREDKEQALTISWDGNQSGINQKGSTDITVPAEGKFVVLDVLPQSGDNQKIDVVFSDPVDASQDMTGLIHFSRPVETVVNVSSNIVTVIPGERLQGAIEMNVEPSLRSASGSTLEDSFVKQLDFTSVEPGIAMEGNGVIVPSSKNLIFPFRAANLKAVDVTIVKIFTNNLPYFLQESDITGGYSMKRFGKPVYSGRYDLVTSPGMNNGNWNLFTIDLADYIDIEPGVLYKVSLGMRKSYSLYPCTSGEDSGRYDEMMQKAEEQSREAWNDPDNYYEDPEEIAYYAAGFNWRDRDDPCKEAYYSPDRRATRNILASNLGIIAKKGQDNILHVIVNDLISALPVPQTVIQVYDFQMQLITSGETNQDGTAALYCERKPFLVIAEKDKDRNYLKTNDGSSLSLSSFDVSGTKPENGIKAFIYGERDVWRPGDSIYLSIFIKDMKTDLPAGHPVQFELINPMEQRVDNQVQKPDGSNLLLFTTHTPQEAVTGSYKAVFRIGGATFTKRVRIETVKPNRLKIDFRFDADILGGDDESETGRLNVKWLNGSTARNLRASVEYLLKHSKTEFPDYSQYNFDDPASEFHSETVNIFEASTDAEGNANVTFKPSDELHAPGMLNAVFTVKAMEPGGDESITQATFRYAPYSVFAGINLPGLKGKNRMLFTDTDNEVRIVTVNEKGKPVNSEVEVSLYKISYRWWWESDDENIGSYISENIYKPVRTETLRTSGGEASWKFNIDKKDWGRYLIKITTPGGHSTGKILLVDWPWEYGMKGNSDGATLLSVSADKEKYTPGEEISLSFPSPENSRVIVTLENATGVLEEIRTNSEKGNTVVKVKATPEMAPNVYAYVTIIQPHAQTVNDMPVRLYGIMPVMVEDPGTRIKPVIDMADELRSQKPFVVKVSEAGSKAMTYTLAIVDEGLLDITGFRTPDPWKYFYAREALGVQTWDLYDNVLGAFGGTLQRLLAIGGDEALPDKSANKAQRFIPVVKFLGPFKLEQGKTNSHAITLPQYTGSVRTMVIAGNDRAFGIAEKAVPVKDPLMVLVTAPRVVSPGEKVELPVTLFVQKDGIREVTIKAETNDLLSISEKSRIIPVNVTGEKNAVFTFTAGAKTGVAKINVIAEGGGETAKYELELDVRSPNPPETRSELRILKPGEKWETSFTPFGLEGSNSAKLDMSALPSINLEKRLGYLIGYPHGCSEQITSAAFPQLYLKGIGVTDSKNLQEIATNIRQAINVITSRQMVNGGLALWPGSYQPDNWVTSYAGHFMIEAEKEGYSVPSGFMQKWQGYQTKLAREWRFDPQYRYTQNDQAYRLFTLALTGQPERGAMNRLRETKDLPKLSRWLLSAAFALTGRTEVANELLDMRDTATEPEYQDYYYGSDLRDKAIILYTLTLLKKEEQALPLLKEICDRFSSEAWYSTQSLSWGLLAYMKWTEMIPAGTNGQMKISVSINNRKDEISAGSKELVSRAIDLKPGNNSVVVNNTSANPVYVTLTRQGIPVTTDATEASKGLSMTVEYSDLKMKPLDQANLVQGTDMMVIVKVTNNTFARIENLALTQMMPSGWEIRNTRLYEAEYGIKEGTFDYRDYRDDRVNTYFLLTPGQTKTFVTIATASYTGEFFQPSIWCEAMYSPGIYARKPGGKVKVTGDRH
ncbi:MAG TPA: MG2 domain-containing protein [Bacteroidales bacterium]|nr:MG2 domain-containing protein [Bacteroidales bacterium]